MKPVTLLPVRHEGWTIFDLDDLPDDGLRYELVDGSLHVSPPASVGHNFAAFRLAVLLDLALDDAWVVLPLQTPVVAGPCAGGANRAFSAARQITTRSGSR